MDTEKQTFEIALQAEYGDTLIAMTEDKLKKILPQYTRHKVLIIKLIDVE